ncbi:hypothetical protein [Micromonospora inositola]|uniref:Uncharacterized protein n=1 Tax=Micromonospora inositola TaxID=47865 RepID=A0A1C5I1K1_9ACTN|nr:hypothetical protein [Micromonospora inositola]SCG52056.1 hypothetical protein GA0070613_2120 [Micromonospora inositola]
MLAEKPTSQADPGVLWYAGRGALVGVAAVAVFLAAAACAQQLIDAGLARQTAEDAANGSGVAVLGATIMTTIELGLPAALVAGLLVGWVLRLPRPWAVPLVGLLLSVPVLCGAGALVSRADESWVRWSVPVVLVAAAHAAAAVTLRRGRSSGRADDVD